MSNKVYDILKWIVVIVLPSTATLYFGLSQIWGFPYGGEISATIAAAETFLGAILMISTANYNKKVSNDNENV